jgi:hypothetical protein
MFNMANAERPTGVNTIPAGRAPAWIYFDGSADYPGGKGVRNNSVFWVNGSDGDPK